LQSVGVIGNRVVLIAPTSHEVNNTFTTVIHRHARAVFLAFLKAFKECNANGFPP
jgi:hypothetical protein